MAAGGTDISHWFDSKTGDLRTHIDPVTFVRVPYTPCGRFLHVPPPYPTSDWRNDFITPWWQDKSHMIGCLTKKARTIRVINTLSRDESNFEVIHYSATLSIKSEMIINQTSFFFIFKIKYRLKFNQLGKIQLVQFATQVCSEDTMLDILSRYLPWNAHAASYTWKHAGDVLDMNKTLEENGIKDEDSLLEELLLNVDDFIPELLLYYNDDLTEA